MSQLPTALQPTLLRFSQADRLFSSSVVCLVVIFACCTAFCRFSSCPAPQSVIDSNPLRNAADAVSSLRTDFDQRLKQSSPIYRSLVLLSKNVNWRKLKPEEQRLVATTMKSMQTSGVTLAAAGRAALNDIESSLVDLEDTFVNNLLDWTDVSEGSMQPTCIRTSHCMWLLVRELYGPHVGAKLSTCRLQQWGTVVGVE